MSIISHWDALVITAGSDGQAAAYQSQLDLRRQLGLLPSVREAIAIADPGGRRVGSGGSTLHCLIQLLGRWAGQARAQTGRQRWQEMLSGRRILIIHAGGESQRLPAYGPCGKIFMPLPVAADTALAPTLFDRQIAIYLSLPAPKGHIVIASGDVLVSFDAAKAAFEPQGMTGLGCRQSPELAAGHGVYCADAGGHVRRFLQKPSGAAQREKGAVDEHGLSILDIGVIGFDAATAAALLEAAGVRGAAAKAAWSGPVGGAIDQSGFDFYREICCALGSETSLADYIASAGAGGSDWPKETLKQLFEALQPISFSVRVSGKARFLHFGATRQLISSGLELVRKKGGAAAPDNRITINTVAAGGAAITGRDAWIEGCRIQADLALAGRNVVVGADIDSPTSLPGGACLDVIQGRSRKGRTVWFVRCYGVEDDFKAAAESGAAFCGRPFEQWLAAAELKARHLWDSKLPAERRTLWNARIFPAVNYRAQCIQWLWLYDPRQASARQKRSLRRADRYSLEEMASLADAAAFYARRASSRAAEVRRSIVDIFPAAGGFSAADVTHLLSNAESGDRAGFLCRLLAEAHKHHESAAVEEARPYFAFPRIMHTIASAVAQLTEAGNARMRRLLPGITGAIEPAERAWLEKLKLPIRRWTRCAQWTQRARQAAFDEMHREIFTSRARPAGKPGCALREDEIVWGRAPVRLDLAGGWTDTPPYALERGGRVINAAVNLNGQPPVHCYARRIDEPLVRLASIDRGVRAEITSLDELLDFGSPGGEFALAKAALTMSGFSTESGGWPEGTTLAAMLDGFGGGLELTTLAAVPLGSGLGVSSIMAAVMLAVVQRMMGRQIAGSELFGAVLRLEQALTTGGGWQDQVGGVAGGVKMIAAAPAILPEPQITPIRHEVLDPHANGGRTLLYYTGITRLAKDILQQVVARYLNRDRDALATLEEIRTLPPRVADAMTAGDASSFGRLIGQAWELNKQLDPNSTNEAVEEIFARVAPHVEGAKLLGAGGGGFLLMVCKTADDAAAVRAALESDPPNERARFFDFQLSTEGLAVTVC